jgi:hypothetical protein
MTANLQDHPAIVACERHGTAAADMAAPKPIAPPIDPEAAWLDYADRLAGESERDRNVDLIEKLAAAYRRQKSLDKDLFNGRISGTAYTLAAGRVLNDFNSLGLIADARIELARRASGYAD